MSTGHWIIEKTIFGHSMSFNMDTLVAMWVAMAFLLVISFIATRNLSIFPTKKLSAVLYTALTSIVKIVGTASEDIRPFTGAVVIFSYLLLYLLLILL